jgi:hypothetical protein
MSIDDRVSEPRRLKAHAPRNVRACKSHYVLCQTQCVERADVPARADAPLSVSARGRRQSSALYRSLLHKNGDEPHSLSRVLCAHEARLTHYNWHNTSATRRSPFQHKFGVSVWGRVINMY